MQNSKMCVLCGRSRPELKRLILGIHGAVCPECVHRCVQILQHEEATADTLNPLEDTTTAIEARERARVEAIRAGMGKFAHLGPAVEELHRERQADKIKEEQQIEGLQP